MESVDWGRLLETVVPAVVSLAGGGWPTWIASAVISFIVGIGAALLRRWVNRRIYEESKRIADHQEVMNRQIENAATRDQQDAAQVIDKVEVGVTGMSPPPYEPRSLN